MVNIFKGLLGSLVGGVEKKVPHALLDVEKENLRKSLSEFNKGLAAQAGQVENLGAQVKKLQV